MIPESLKRHIEEQLGKAVEYGSRASGGSINEAAVMEVADTGSCFLKWNRSADPDMFVKEVEGLRLLKEAGTDLVIPGVVDHGVVDGTVGYLLMEYIEEGSPGSDSSEEFGHELATLHKLTEERFGLDHNNYIGKLPQSNNWHDSWIDFFIEERMEPQLKMARDSGRLSAGIENLFQNMYRELPSIFPDEPPSLLHGDLWGGNYFFNSQGKAAIYDPAVYFGNREIELAFTHMFGGFTNAFYRAYEESWSLQSDFNSRRDIYNLYPLLVHTNLFGGHYGRQVESIVRRFD